MSISKCGKTLSVSICLGLALSPLNNAEAGFFKNFFQQVVSAVAGLPIPSNPAMQLLTQTINLFTNCDESSVDGVRTHCIDATGRTALSAGVEVLKARNYLISRNGTVDPYYQFKSHTSHFVNWESAQMRFTYPLGYVVGCNGGNVLACHSLDGTTFLNSSGLALSPVKMAAMLMHEGDHYNKLHSCGDSADTDLSGPFGLQIQYLISVYQNKPWNVTSGQASEAYSVAWAYASGNLCGRTDLRDQAMSYLNSGSLYVSSLNSPAPAPNSTPVIRCGTRVCMAP